MSTIAKYASVFNIGLQNTFVYRWNYFLRALFGLIPLAGTVFLWGAVFKERGGGLHGYDYSSMIYYYLLTILVSNLVVPTEDEWQIAADIRVLDFVDNHYLIHLLFIRIFPRRPDVSDRHHARRGPSRDEVAAVLL